MSVEIERKFLVNSDDFIAQASSHTRIVQAYLNSNKQRTVRVRIRGQQGFLTIKGASNESGLSRYEWEKDIPLAEAEQLLTLCEPGAIDKVRYLVSVAQHIFEVDVFAGDNHGLVVAEVELGSEQECFEKPSWLGQEVTGQTQYYNSQLSQNPFKNWP
ncbi:CYTH domain-containing protein [Agarivorans sp. 1_MG-2023]|uniref:CYTH domain-containing protein n=1 Tax=Agarivorans sp. 1_MG-2023 TaxID=3062634 RepID=UPI0026E43CC3|nr:CYTH domain-containing protein [Agarivorans sp. 1_MG-2023]MDO6764255.1 CYTH domain-containing protein [Agarivorans sp. 1_MG-2023]